MQILYRRRDHPNIRSPLMNLEVWVDSRILAGMAGNPLMDYGIRRVGEVQFLGWSGLRWPKTGMTQFGSEIDGAPWLGRTM